MLKLSQVCRPLFTTKFLGRHVTPFVSQKSLECLLDSQKIAHITVCRSASTFSLRDEELIYTAPLANRIFIIKCFTFFTSIFSVPIQLKFLLYHEEVQKRLFYQVFLVMGIVFQSTMPLIIHFMAKRYVVRMYYNSVTDKYTIVTYNFVPTDRYTTFDVSEVDMPTVELLSTVVIKKKFPVFFDPVLFKDLKHYKRLLGYDKPIKFSEDKNEKESVLELEESKNKENPS